MKTLLRKIANVYAKSTTTTSFAWWLHATKAPATLIKK